MADRLTTAGRDEDEAGFTVIEVLIALLVLLLGMAGILSLQLNSVQATAFSRHATEASILAEDKMEVLRTEPLVGDNDQVNALGELDTEGLYLRTWTITGAAPLVIVTVAVTWLEEGGEPYSVTLRTQRKQ